ncbi:Glutamate synthase (NADPH) small chain [Pelotomaculum schinkii]|uniref:Glutamate synthase (NADPH) small chain n=1 Tax=Pelotomaculum schinkii TaxID=78350 RepID=A0A4Y7RGF6_9FIRM|nr:MULTISPECIES: pyridine nucleotide-disulfide oxidoreductase/dicluster-binding protein [Pelotomaculum]TEB08084.1 Glutamate synthase (NADPH) small chain [Pelotomaculum schinkii]TEB15776.1 Glutamate synthase (NADPH) small chain [Pelotomaculum sp. FP]
MDNEKLLKTGDRCIYDEPAACTAWCPIHMDVAAFVAEMGKGNFNKAYKILEKRMPFTRVLGMICDHPCESACVREAAGGAIRISELEKAAVKHGYTPPKKALPIPKNAGKVAVIGGGLSGISAALELDRKGFKVTIYEKSDKLGGRLWDYEGANLEKAIIEEELQIFSKLDIEVIFNRRISQKELKEIINENNAVFLGTGEWNENLQINPETFQVQYSSLFAGGRLLYKNGSTILSVSSGRRAAASVERYVKRLSMTAAREREGAFETPLKYEVDDIEPAAPVVRTTDVYSEDEAVNEAGRCFKCRCTKCIDSCSHMKKFNIGPKNYTRQINHNENVILGTRYANKMINSCTMCGLCGEQCHVGINMKDIIQETRESMVEKGKMPPSAHDFALQDMEFSNSSHFFLVKSPSPKYAQSLFKGDESGTEQADYLFYPGCQLSASYPEYVEKAYKYLLSRIKEGVGIMLGCCGAPADWAGRQDLMKNSIERLRDAWAEMGKPTFILACSSCCGIFEKYLPEIPFISLWEIFERYGLPETAQNGKNHILNVHDACSTRHNKNIHESLRNIAVKLGYEIKELKYAKEKTKCCGYGGLVYFANREQTNDFVIDRINESNEDFLVYCAICKDLFVEGGKSTYHILDLIFGENLDEIAHKKMPNLSQRHANRAQLKKKLLRELWNEESEAELTKMEDLIIPSEVWRIMDERYILLEDIEKVIKHAQESGERFFNPEDSSFLANQRIGNVTYWVRYIEKDGAIQVVTVYSHRMEVKKE